MRDRPTLQSVTNFQFLFVNCFDKEVRNKSPNKKIESSQKTIFRYPKKYQPHATFEVLQWRRIEAYQIGKYQILLSSHYSKWSNKNHRNDMVRDTITLL